MSLREQLEEFRDALLEDAKGAYEAAPDMTRLMKADSTSIAMQAINCEFAAKMVSEFLNATERKP